MAVKLGELLVLSNMITQTQLQQALKAQKLYGGRLGTNLVELGLITETQLTQFLSKQLNIPAVQPQDLERIPQEILALIPKEFAKHYKVIPIGMQHRKLRVAFGDPLDLDAQEKTAFRVGQLILPMIAPEVLINYALEKHYGVPIEKRYLKMAEDEEASLSGEGSFDDLLMRTPSAQLTYNNDLEEVSASRLIKKGVAYNLENLSRDLFQASSKEHVFRALFRLLEPHFSQIAVFVPRLQEIWGWELQGFTMEAKKFRQKFADLSQTSAIVDVFKQRDIILSAILSELDRNLIAQMGGNLNTNYHLFPLSVQGKVLACFLVTTGGHPSHEVGESLTDTIQAGLALGGIGLQMVALRRKLLVNLTN